MPRKWCTESEIELMQRSLGVRILVFEERKLEHPGTYVVRIRGGPKTDRRGWGFGFELDGHGICNGICIWGGAGGGWRYLQKKRAYQRRWYRIAY